MVQWVEEGKSVWDIARVARNPFNLQTRCTKVEEGEGQVHGEDSGVAAAFIKHNLISEPREGGGEAGSESDEQTRRRAPSDIASKRVRKRP